MKRLYTILAIFLLFLPDIFADGITDEEEIKKNMPKYAANINNVGRDYWFTVPPAYLIGGIDNFIKIFVFSAEESEVTVSVPGLGYKELKAIPKNNVAVYNISPATAQVKIYSYNEGPLDAELHRGRGINVTSPSPITVYCVVRYSATSDGFLCIPTNALGNSYVASPYSSRPIGGPDQSLPNMVGVTATQDNTKMKFTLGGNSGTEVPMGGGKYLLPGQSKTYKMDRGDVVVFSNRSGAETLTGSLIEADKNIAVVSAHYCADIPVDNHWCDYNGEMDLPIHSWGQHYHVPMVQRRKYPSVLRIMAAKDKTTVFRDGYEIGFINDGKGGFEQSGWMERRVLSYVPDLNGIALYSGDKPIYVMFYNVGTQEDGNGYDPTDPFSMVLSPVEQYQNEIKFCTPAVNGEGKNFSNNYVMLVYALDEFGTQPDDLEIGDYRNGEFVYKPVPNEGTDMQYVTLDEVNSVSGAELKVPAGLGDKKYAMKVFDVSEGVHSLRSSLPFACYAYGGDPYDSYGYPTAAALKDLSTPDTIPPLVEWEIDCLGLVEGGTAQDLPEDKNIRSNLYDIRVIQEETFNFGDVDFEPKVAKGTKVIPPDTEIATWTIQVEDITKEAQATIMFMDRAGNITIDTIMYYPQELVLVDDVTGDAENSFYGADIRIGDKVVRTFKITNQSELDSLVIDRIELKFGDNGFKILTFPESPIGPMESTYMDVEFEGTEQGRFTDVLGVGNDCIFDFTMNLEAIVGMALIEAYDVDFDTPFNISNKNAKAMKKKLILSASCNSEVGSDLIITGIDDSNLPAEFTHNIPNSFTIPTGDGESGVREFEIEFMPTTTGDFNGHIAFIAENGGCDSISVITASALMQAASASSYDWEKREILRPGFVETMYSGTDLPLPITFNNSSTSSAVAYNGVKRFTPNNLNDIFFVEDQNNLGNYLNIISNQDQFTVNLPMGTTDIRNIRYNPTTVGEHELSIVFESQNDIDTAAYTLKGIGIAPNLNVGGMDEGEAFSHNFGEVNYMDTRERKISISNIAINPDWGMDLTIYDIAMDNGFTYDMNELGSNGKFYHVRAEKDGTDLPLPLADFNLKLGESIDFYFTFTPVYAPSDANGNHNASFTINSNADNTGANGSGQNGKFSNQIELAATAIPQEFTVSGVDLTTCISQEATGTVTITRTQGSFNITAIDFGATNANAMTFVNKPVLPITLDDTNPTLSFDVAFNPGSLEYDPSTQSYSVVVTSDITDVNADAVETSTNTLEATFAERTISGKIVDGGNNEFVATTDDSKTKKMDIGEEITYQLNLNSGESIASGAVTKLRASVMFNSHFLKYVSESSIKAGPAYENDYSIKDINVALIDDASYLYEITFTMEQNPGSTMLINQDGVLAFMKFNAVLPGYEAGVSVDIKDENMKTQIIHDVQVGEEGEDNSCIAINGDNPVPVMENEICVYTQRFLTLSSNDVNGAESSTGVIIPSQGTDITFSIAFEAQTSLTLINQNGEKIKELINERRQAGENSYFFVPQDISSGVYFLELNADGFRAITKVIIQK